MDIVTKKITKAFMVHQQLENIIKESSKKTPAADCNYVTLL